MKALMFGWEFPPHILGGLGTASYGLTRGMAMQPDMDITFCIPKPWGDEDQSFLRIIGVNNVPIVWRDVNMDYARRVQQLKALHRRVLATLHLITLLLQLLQKRFVIPRFFCKDCVDDSA